MQYEADNKTPELTIFIDGKNPNSFFYKNLRISYPNKKGKSADGLIKIHSLPNGK